MNNNKIRNKNINSNNNTIFSTKELQRKPLIRNPANNNLSLSQFEYPKSLEYKIINETKHQIIRAALKLIIITKMSERTAMSTLNIIQILRNEFNTQ